MLQLAHLWIRAFDRDVLARERRIPPAFVAIAPEFHPGQGEGALGAREEVAVLRLLRICRVFARGELPAPRRRHGVRQRRAADRAIRESQRHGPRIFDRETTRSVGGDGAYPGALAADVARDA